MKKRHIATIISILLHIVLIWWFTTIVMFRPLREPGIIKTSLTKIEPLKPGDLSGLFRKLPEIKEVPKVEIPYVSLDSGSVPKQIQEIPEVIKEIIETEEVSVEKIEKSVLKIGQTQGVMPGFGRELVPARKGFYGSGISKRKLSQMKERAILRALEWLQYKQNPDGSWGKGEPVAVTGLALLAFLSHEETQFTPRYGLTVDKALRYLGGIAESNKYGFMGAHIQPSYQHAVATHSLLEAYGMSGSYRLLNLLKKAVNTIVRTQGPKGGWIDYYDSPTPDNRGNTFVTAWQVMALKAAVECGIKEARAREALRKSTEFLLFVYGNPGFGLYKPGQRLDLNAMGVFSLQLCGETRSSEVTRTLSLLKTPELNWGSFEKDEITTCYFITRAMHYGGISHWGDWNKKITQLLLSNQNKDGSWTLPEKSTQIEYSEQADETEIYTTALCTLMLGVEYRSLIIGNPQI